MPNRTEARPAKAVLTYATGRLPLLRLFSTPLVDSSVLDQEQESKELRFINFFGAPFAERLSFSMVPPQFRGWGDLSIGSSRHRS
jgi:hypothetical protein